MPKIDLSEGEQYIKALKAAAIIPYLATYQGDSYGIETTLEQAMELVDEWCPHLWPAIDKRVLAIISHGSE